MTEAGRNAAVLLKKRLGADKVVLAGESPPDLGKYGTGFYFTAQARETLPAARVLPQDTADIVFTLDTVRQTGTTFAVKSGGHGTYGSAANAAGGITIDLSRFKEITIAPDRKSVFVGGGCRWGEVYSTLDREGLSVVGGRISSVGVGGLTLGGGISFFSSEHGLACDNVKSYELVMANGRVVNVTRESEPDLFWAMRGCGMGFGIITRFELNAFEVGKIWGGASTYPPLARGSVFDSFHKFVVEDADVKAEAFLIATDVAKDGNCVYTMVMSRSLPEEDPVVFDDFKKLEALASSTKIRSLTDLCDEIDAQNEAGFRFKTTAQSIKLDYLTMNEILSIHTEVTDSLKDIDGFLPSLLYQPLTPAMLPTDDIGNALGIKPDDGPLIVICLLWKWNRADDDSSILEAASAFMHKVDHVAKARGVFHPYQYLNYAAGDQDIYGGYGEDNRKKVLEICRRYDAQDLMLKMRPGIIQLSGSNAGKGNGR